MQGIETSTRRIVVAFAIGVAALAAALCAVLLQDAKPAGAATAHAAKKAKMVTATKTFTSTTPDQPNQRYEVYCPKGTRPFGGGVTATPPVSPNGNGIYPTSSERLGKQEGWHITVHQEGQGTYQVKLQVFCRKFKGDIDPVEQVLGFHVEPGETRSITATCKGKKKLVSGGFLSSQFFSPALGGGQFGKGVYVTESRGIDKKTWRITATGVPGGGKGGEVNPIAYCLMSKKPLLKELSSAPASLLGTGTLATAVAPACPKNKPFSVGGYSSPNDGTIRAFDTNLSPSGAWSASGQGFLGGAGQITAHAYCLKL